MPRRRKLVTPKIISINRSELKSPSAHVLDLRSKLLPPPPPRWQPSELAQSLAHPWKSFGPKINPPKLPSLKLSRPRLNLNLNFAWPKVAWAFAAVCLIFILPLQAINAYSQLAGSRAQIINIGADAFSHLYAGSASMLSLNLGQAAAELNKATELFNQSQAEINKINPLWRSTLSLLPIIGDKYQSGQHLLLAGQNLALAADTVAQTVSASTLPTNALEVIKQIEKITQLVLPPLQEATEHLQAVNLTNLPPGEQERFIQVKEKIQILAKTLTELPELSAKLRAILGEGQPKRYLLLFQNNGESRPTGGFLGSFAVIHIKDGLLQKMVMPGGGTFALAGNLKVSVKTPLPLQIMRTRWEMQDANWFADFPTSAKKIAWFYEKSGGTSLDGLAAIDASFFKELLKITGPIELPEYGQTINSENFIAVTQQQVEFAYDQKLNQPKQFLADLAPKVLDKLWASKGNLLGLLSLFEEGARQKHWQLFSFDQELQNFLVTQGLAGEIKDNPNGDFLSVVNTNIAGQKTDWVMEQTISHQARIDEDGSIIDTVTIIRTHHGKENDLLTGVQNVNYLRLYVPAGSQLLSASGFEQPPETAFKAPEQWLTDDADLKKIEAEEKIDAASGTRITTEFGKTVLANWSMTKPGATSVLTLSYRLPAKFNNSYSLLVQKQAGTDQDLFTDKIILPEGYQIRASQGAVNDKILLREDEFLGIVASK